VYVVHPCVREWKGKRHSLFRKTSHHLDLQSLFVDNADFSEDNYCLHQVLYSRNPVSGPGETHHLLITPCNEMRCVNFTRSRESAHSYGRIIGCRSSYRKLSEAVTRPHALISPFWSKKRFRERIEDGPRKAVIVFDIAGQIDEHTRGPAMLYLIWKSDPGNLCRHRCHTCFDGTIFDLGHRQFGSLAGPMIAWLLQPSGFMPPKRVIQKLLKGNSSTSQNSWIVFGSNV